MDFTKNTVLKENYTFLVADSDGQIRGGERGLYNRDTRFLSRYRWRFDTPDPGGGFQTLLAHSPRPDRFEAHHALIRGPSQLVGVRRELRIAPLGLVDRLQVENTDLERQRLSVALELACDFVDLFEARGWHQLERASVERTVHPRGVRWRYRAVDGVDVGTDVDVDRDPDAVDAEGVRFTLELAPGERLELGVRVSLHNPFESVRAGETYPGETYDAWRARFGALALRERPRWTVLRRAVDDLRALLLFGEHGALLAAGIPWFVAAFGRDSLLSAHMLLEYAPEVAEGTLRFLAAYQGKTDDAARAEEPGKIIHELRYGELTRSGRVPFGPYYGTVDATPLWIVLLHAHALATGSLDLARELRAALEDALAWTRDRGDLDGDGFLEFVGAEHGEGLAVQSWKDSSDSMSHADGSLARGPIAVSEVQGYAYASYLAAAELFDALGEPDIAQGWRGHADALRRDFHRAFWQESLGTYALALDGDKRPLAVHSSDAGQLLWTGVVPDEVAPRLVETLFSAANWSGWGVRTLGADEARYNPLSYHNGSVWPHDNALIAAGLARYGFVDEAHRIAEAIFDLAASQTDHRVPELVAGYPRTPDEPDATRPTPPVPYPVACRPQAWDAAALVFVAALLD